MVEGHVSLWACGFDSRSGHLLKHSSSDLVKNDFLIAGLTIWKGNRLAIALWGNDSTSEMKDGFFNEETIYWAIVKNNQYLPIQLFYRVGQNTWEPNGIHIVDSLKFAS